MQLISRYKKLWSRLTGESEDLHNINIVVNSICVITFGLLFIMMISDILLGLYNASLLILSLLIVNAILYWYSRWRQKYDAVILIYTIISYFALGFNYLFNFGINGPTVLGFFLTFLLLVAIVHRKYHLLVAIVHTVLLIALYFVEYYIPQWFPSAYTSDLTRIADWSVAYLICLAFTYFIVIFLRDNYKKERLLAQQQAIDISVQNEQLKLLIAEKDKLFSLVSHDIATPLTLIQGYLEMLEDDHVENEAQIKRELLKTTKRTSDMLMNMLTWSKSQMKGVKVDIQSFNLNDTIQRNLPLYYSIAKGKSIHIDVSRCEDVIVKADHEMTKAVIRNLLSNAIKFTPANGRIDLAVERNGTYCYLHIKDTGIGMSAEKMETLFKLSTKTTYGTDNETGLGLGLVLCKEFAELQDGSISVQSIEHQGSTFSVGLLLCSQAYTL